MTAASCVVLPIWAHNDSEIFFHFFFFFTRRLVVEKKIFLLFGETGMWLGTDTTHTGSQVDRRDQTMFEYRLISLSLSPWLGTAPLYIPFRHERVYFIKINTNQDRWFFCCVLFFCSRVCVWCFSCVVRIFFFPFRCRLLDCAAVSRQIGLCEPVICRQNANRCMCSRVWCEFVLYHYAISRICMYHARNALIDNSSRR